LERLQRILAARGVASRRAAETLITEGRVAVNGQIVTELGTRANPATDEIRVDNEIIRQPPLRYLMLNKPTGYITTTSDERDRWTVMDLVRVSERVFPVGRLDRDTEGLLLLTNDGDIAHRIMHPRYKLTKEYHVLTRTRPTESQLQRIRDGVVIEQRRVIPEEVRLLRETADGPVLTISVHEGINHLIRRIMDVAGIEVQRLRRARVGPISLSNLRVGEWRDLTAGELGTLMEALRVDDQQITRQATRTIKSGQGGTQGPANPLWRRPKRAGEAEPVAPRPAPDRGRRGRGGSAQPQVVEERSGQENDQHDDHRRERTEQRGTDRERPERDRHRRSGRVRQDDDRRPAGRPPRRRLP
jgi:23S rRNA pseudouridine2605 synthase